MKYRLTRIMDPDTEHLLVLSHPQWGQQTWIASFTPEEHRCACCDWLRDDIAYRPLSNASNCEDRICRPCAEQMIRQYRQETGHLEEAKALARK